MTTTDAGHQVHVEIGGGPAPWSQYVKVNGHMLDCETATLEMDASEIPVLTVKLPVIDGVAVGLDNALFKIERESRAALIAMGWTPPGEAPCALRVAVTFPGMITETRPT